MLSRREKEATWSCKKLTSLQNKEGSMLVGGWIFTEVEEFQYRNYSFSLHGPSPHHKKKNSFLHISWNM